MKKRILSVLTAMCLCLTLLPTMAFAEGEESTTTTAKDITLGYSALHDADTTNAKWDYVYFGTYNNSPIKWRVLSTKGNSTTVGTSEDTATYKTADGEAYTGKALFMLSENTLFDTWFYGTTYDNAWLTSNLRNKMQNDIFSNDSAELKYVLKTTKTDSSETIGYINPYNNNQYSIIWGGSGLSEDTLFALSAREVEQYLGSGEKYANRISGNAAWWWLRSPSSGDTNDAGVVKSGGVVVDYSVDYGLIGVRPALNLNLSSVLFTSAAVGGKSSNAAVGGVTGIFENKNYADITGNDGYKLTLLDESRSDFSAYLKSVSGNTATVSYSGAKTGTNEYISVIIKNGGTVKYYGRVASVSDASAASGEVNITLPSDFSTANGDVLCVFNEQYNGDKNTDYASKLIDVTHFDYTVNFDANGGDGTMASQTMTYGTTANLSANTFTRSGYTFNGWNTQADGTGETYSDGQSVTNLVSDASEKSVTLYAQWTHVDHTGGTATCTDKAVCTTCGQPYGDYDAHKFTVENKDATGALKTAGDCQHEAVYYKSCSVCGAVSTSETDTFEGELDPNIHTGPLGDWQKDENGHWKTYSCCPTVKGAEGTHSFDDGKCECGAVQYTVTFDANGGGVDTASATTDIYGKLTALPTPTRNGSYRFDGWFTEKDGGTAVTTATVFTAPAIVYAHWTYTGGSSAPTYSITAPTAANGTVTVSPRYAERGDTVTITVTPDAGYTLETLIVLDKNGNKIELTDKGNGKYSFKMPAGKVTVNATFMDDNTMLNFFTDVTADKYYYDAVLWAAKNGITGGIDENHFGPDLSCTRAQLVTFLWRAAGCPVVDYAMSFTDVGDGYYTEAVRWAASLGIVGGYGNGLFGTGDTITREQFVTILYRFAKAMGMDGSVGEDANILSYNDTFDVSEYAFSAFQWAVGEGIVQGADGNLMPQNPCTRAQIVTMLYRLLGE